MTEQHTARDAPTTATPGWHTVEVDGMSVAYEVRGSGPLIVAHAGGPGVSAAYLRMPLVERFATVVYLDPVGTGRSDRIPDGDYSMSAYARIAAAVIAGLPGGPAVFLGHSHGGMVALQLALDHPDAVSGVIVYEGRATYTGIGEEATDRMDAFARRFPGDPIAEDARAAFDEVPAPEDRAKTKARLMPAYLADFRNFTADLPQMVDDTRSFVDPNRRNFSEWDIRPRLPEVRVPLTVFVGKYDFICGPTAAATIWQDVPDADLVTFQNSGHVAHVEEPEAFAAAVHRFVSRQTGTAA